MYVGVICKREGFRRAGRAWPAGPSVAEVTEEGFEQLKADSTFEVQEISEEQFKLATQANVDLSIDDGGKAGEGPNAVEKVQGSSDGGTSKSGGAPKGAREPKGPGEAKA